MVGSSAPSTRQASAVSARAGHSSPPDRLMIAEVIFTPSPVIAKMPTMRPEHRITAAMKAAWLAASTRPVWKRRIQVASEIPAGGFDAEQGNGHGGREHGGVGRRVVAHGQQADQQAEGQQEERRGRATRLHPGRSLAASPRKPCSSAK